MKAVLITIGNEVLNGQVIDTNAAWLAQALLAQGISVKEKWSVADSLDDITEALQHACNTADLIITTGGLGPTVDDLTCEALARFLQVSRVFHEDTFDKLSKIFASIGRVPTESHRMQCLLPENVTTIPNKNGTAPGMYFFHKGKHIISMPGVPFEMKAIFDPHVIELLQSVKKGPKRRSHTINTVGEGETVLEDLIKDITQKMPGHMGIAFLPDLYKVRIRIDIDSEDEIDVRLYEDVIEQIKDRLANYIVGENETTLELAIGQLLKQKGWMMGTAESCTGGYIAHLITSNSGSSEYYKGSVIAYSNEIKEKNLAVSTQSLNEQGAVSEQVVKEMAVGAIQAMGCDVALSISGVAGPTGGSAEKPVGLVWIGIADKHHRVVTKKIQLRRDRLLNIRAAANMALISLFHFLKG